MYATFVAPVQQYSTETEPSRQPSFNHPSPSSRQPSFKQNSSETEHHIGSGGGGGGGGAASAEAFPAAAAAAIPPPPIPPPNDDDAVYDIYQEVPSVGDWPLPPLPKDSDGAGGGSDDEGDLVEEISQVELEHQAAQERDSFISGGGESSTNGDDEEEEPEVNADLQNAVLPSSLPPPPYLIPNAKEPDETARLNTVRRKSKRDRNRTQPSVIQPSAEFSVPKKPVTPPPPAPPSAPASQGPSAAAAAIVIVRRQVQPHSHHQKQQLLHKEDADDVLSESSVSFHENELRQRIAASASSQQQKQKSRQNGGRVPQACEFPRDVGSRSRMGRGGGEQAVYSQPPPPAPPPHCCHYGHTSPPLYAAASVERHYPVANECSVPSSPVHRDHQHVVGRRAPQPHQQHYSAPRGERMAPGMQQQQYRSVPRALRGSKSRIVSPPPPPPPPHATVSLPPLAVAETRVLRSSSRESGSSSAASGGIGGHARGVDGGQQGFRGARMPLSASESRSLRNS